MFHTTVVSNVHPDYICTREESCSRHYFPPRHSRCTDFNARSHNLPFASARQISVQDVAADDKEGEEGVRRRRSVFLESFYLPFASFLLRDVGASWLPVWDAEALQAQQSSRPRSPRDVFEAFFRPPAVPASLALLALCEALEGKGRDTRAFSIGGQLLPRRSEHNSTGDGMARAPIEASAAAAAQASATSDETAASAPRTGHVQHVCRLLEQYLDNTSRGVHLLAVAVAEFAQSTDAAVINAEEFATEAVAGEGGGEGEGERQDLRYCLSNGPPLTMRGGDAAEVLASALCLAPRRVANSLGPAAPLALSPAAFYPVVCKAAVHATVRCLGASTAFTVFDERAGLVGSRDRTDGGVEKAGSNDTGEASAGATASFGEYDSRNAERSWAASRHDADPGAYAGTGFAGDVWRAFSGRLLSAGRASDLAEAWLQVMVEEGVGAGRGGREGDRKSGEKVKKETTHEKAVTASVSAATAWEDWVDGPSGSEVHSRMVVRLPASWRKPFTEALLRALWPYSSYEPRRQGLRPRSCNSTRALEGGEPWEEHWPEGFQAAACRVLVGRPLFPLFQPTVTSRIEEGGGLKVNAASAAMNQRQEGESGERYKIPVGIVEELVLQRPLPPPAAEAIADTLAWCDRRRISQIMTTTTSKSDSNAGSKKDGSRGRLGEGLLVGALKRVAAVWAEPSFLNQSPPRQQEFYTRFLLAALRRWVAARTPPHASLAWVGKQRVPSLGASTRALTISVCLYAPFMHTRFALRPRVVSLSTRY